MKNFWKNKKVLITGGHGFVGKHLVNRLIKLQAKITAPSSKEYDLREKSACKRIVRDQEVIIHLAAKVGGIGFNMKYPGEMFYDNLMMGAQLMEQARIAGVRKFIALGTVCAYPKYTKVPFQEIDFWDGYPEETNAPYGLAKKMLLVQAQAYRKQYGFNTIYLIPVNMYGPGDNFNPLQSHVIPALIKKVVEAKLNRKTKIEVWGTGQATRAFLYVKDCVEGILLAGEKYNEDKPVNLGAGNEISIKDLIKQICLIISFKGNVFWDTSKPDGQPRRMLDTSLAINKFGFKAKTPLEEGLKHTIEWYIKQNKLSL